MNSTFDQLAKSILKKDTLSQCSVDEIQQLVSQYPYFAPAHLLLAKKLQTENSEQFKVQLERTSLFFNNPLLLEQLMNDSGNAEITLADNTKAATKVEETLIKDEIKNEDLEQQIENAAITEQADISLPEESNQEENTDHSVELPSLKIEPIDPNKTELLYAPYHTIDYFASQDIKYKEEEQPKDRFSQQLKSFTEWLKVLRRLPATEIEKNMEPNADRKVEQLANQSLQDREIVTEAMADVWIKQGNTEKAIDIYNKLSLLDASKRPYFAAKIEELKKTN